MKIGVCGAGGRMGREVCRAVLAEKDLGLVCAVDPAFAGVSLDDLIPGASIELSIDASVEAMSEKDTDVMVDFTVAGAARENVTYALNRGIHCVVGTTGFEEQDLLVFDDIARSREVGCLLAPNYAIGAVLMMDFARKAARFMEACEIVELHHPGKMDAPSGTARNTARVILEAQGRDTWDETDRGPRGLEIGGIHVHSVRLPGMVAHQEVIFGDKGQTLTVRHDSTDRTSFMPGVIMGLRKVPEIKGLVVGLDKVLEMG